MNYVHFDTLLFLKNSKNWGKQKKKLNDELMSMSEIPSRNNPSGVRSGKISKLPQDMALRTIEIKDELAAIELQEEMLKYGLDTLSEDEKSLVVGLYLSSKRNGIVVWEWGRKYGLNKDYVYREVHRILREMGDKIEARYY